jgi:hypothetical protein
MVLKCGEQFNRRYVKGDKIPPALAMLRGRGQHTAQEMDLGMKLDTGILAPEPDLIDVAADKVRKDAESKDDVMLDKDEQEIGFEAARGKTIDQAIRATQLHHRHFAPVIEPDELEIKLEFDIPTVDGPRPVVGYADVIELDGSIPDSKSTMQKPSALSGAESDQLGLYAFGYRQIYGTDSPSQRLDYMVLSQAQNPTEIPIPKPKKGQEAMTAEQAMKAASAKLVASLAKSEGMTLVGLNGRDRALRVEGTQSHDDQARTILRMQEAIASIDAGFFPPAPQGVWWCSAKWCGYHATCPYVRGGASILVPGVNDE